MELIGLFIVILILGALAGGRNLGEIISGGCGVLLAIIAVLVILLLVAIS
jgi:hypothetical protein